MKKIQQNYTLSYFGDSNREQISGYISKGISFTDFYNGIDSLRKDE